MSLFKIVTKPTTFTNLGANPSLEVDTTNWSAVGTAASIAQNSAHARFGRYSLAVTSGTSVLGGAYYYTAGTGISISTATAYVVSFYVKNESRAIRISARDNASVELAVSSTIAAQTGWHREELTFTTGGGSTTVHFRFTNDNDGTSHVFYVDAVLVEDSVSNASVYFDGDQPSAWWDGVEHASQSLRSGSNPLGNIKTFADLDASLYDARMTGGEMPPVVINQQPYAKLPGSVYEGTKIRGRTSNLIVLADGTSINDLHLVRESLLDAVKPDRIDEQEPFRLIYTAGTNDVYADFVYEGGLEGGERMGFTETFGLRLFAPDPFWYEDTQEIGEPATLTTVTKEHVLKRELSVWDFPTGTGANGNILAIRAANNGQVLFGGAFTDFAGVGDTARIAKLRGDTISEIGAGVDDGEVRAIAIAADGDTAYLGGTFAAVDGGTTVNKVVEVEISDDTYNTIGAGPGLDGNVNAIAIGLDGSIYFGGAFTDVSGGGGGTYNRIVKWDGSSFSAMGTGANGTVRAIAIAPNGDVYVGGDFTDIGGVSTNRIAYWDGSAWNKVGFSAQMNAEVRALVFSPDGKLYAGGDFTTASGNAVNRISVWSGSDWLAMESGLDGDVYSLAWEEDLLWVGGTFDNTGGTPSRTMPRLAVWNGSSFVHPDITPPSAITVNAIETVFQFRHFSDVYIGHTGTGAARIGVKTTVTNNGTANAYPIIAVAPGVTATLRWIENRTTGERLWFDIDMSADEVITIDLRPHKKTLSSNWRPYPIQPLPGSDLASFRLMPGGNGIVAYISSAGSPAALGVRWQPTHWSRDGSA